MKIRASHIFISIISKNAGRQTKKWKKRVKYKKEEKVND